MSERCRYRGVLTLGEKRWEWCFLYNMEISESLCERCIHGKLREKPVRIRKEIIS